MMDAAPDAFAILSVIPEGNLLLLLFLFYFAFAFAFAFAFLVVILSAAKNLLLARAASARSSFPHPPRICLSTPKPP
jgi:hypothetical protein